MITLQCTAHCYLFGRKCSPGEAIEISILVMSHPDVVEALRRGLMVRVQEENSEVLAVPAGSLVESVSDSGPEAKVEPASKSMPEVVVEAEGDPAPPAIPSSAEMMAMQISDLRDIASAYGISGRSRISLVEQLSNITGKE